MGEIVSHDTQRDKRLKSVIRDLRSWIMGGSSGVRIREKGSEGGWM